MNPKDETIVDPAGIEHYQGVPAEQSEALARFREANPQRTTEVAGSLWRYRLIGSGAESLLWLPGALLESDSVWQQAERFGRRFRVLVPTYPPVPTMSALADGLVGLLAAEGLGSGAVVGGSYGGMVAQVLVRRHPGTVRRLVLSHTFPPDPGRGMKARVAGPLFALMPEGAVRRMYWRRMAALIPKAEAAAWLRGYLSELVQTRIEKDDILALYRRAADFDAMEFAASDLADWPGDLALVLSEDDPTTPETVRTRLIELYPQAQVHVLSGTGHAAALLKPEQYFRTLADFLES